MKTSMQNFLAYQEKVEIDLNKINLFIGANNCGKSTLGKLQVLIGENRWHTGISSTSNKFLTLYSWSLSNLYHYHSIENIINDNASKNEITLAFSRKINEIVYEIEVKLQKSKFLKTQEGIEEIKAAEVFEFKVIANGNILIQLWDNVLRVCYSELSKALETLPVEIIKKIVDNQEELSQLLSDLSNEEDFILNLEENGNLQTKNGDKKEPLEILQILFAVNLVKKPDEIIIFLKEISATITRPLNSWRKIDFQNRIDLDYIARIETNRYLEKFQLQLEKKPLYTKNIDGDEKIVGYDWLLRQQDKTRLLSSFGSGTICLINFISQLGVFMDSLIDFDSEGNMKRSKNPDSIVSIEEPEKNLHPDWQIQLAKLLIEEISEYSTIILETHSIHILKTIQVEIAKGNIRSEDVTIHEFYRDDNNGVVRVNPMQFDQNGFLENNGYFKGNFNSLLSQLDKELFDIQQARIQAN